MISSFGWTREVISSSVPDLRVYEYRKDNFRMVLVQNTRLKKKCQILIATVLNAIQLILIISKTMPSL